MKIGCIALLTWIEGEKQAKNKRSPILKGWRTSLRAGRFQTSLMSFNASQMPWSIADHRLSVSGGQFGLLLGWALVLSLCSLDERCTPAIVLAIIFICE